MPLRRQLPIGIQTFRKIRESDCYYVDKTGFALRLVESGTHYFLSRPRRDWYRNNPIARYEGYYASVFYAYFASLGLGLTPEQSSNAGRLDMALRFNSRIYLFEFKVVELEPEGRALQQIKDRGYADRYRADGCPIHLIGMEFSSEQRSVVGFEVEDGL